MIRGASYANNPENLFIATNEDSYLPTPEDHVVVPGNTLSRVLRKPAFCICENKGADQLHSNCPADHGLCFRYIDTTIPLLPKSENSNLNVGPGHKPLR